VRVALLGLGSSGRRHAAALLELGHGAVGFDPNASSPPAGVSMVSSPEEAIASGDAVIVASPNAFHAEQACMALEKGRPVLIEKPLATTPTEGQEVGDLADRTGLVCGVAMNLRFHPGIRELKRLVDEGTLGRPRFASASFGYDLRLWRPGLDYRHSYSGRAELGGGIVLDAIHELDYLLWLLGPVKSVSAEVDRISDLEIDVEDIAVANLRFASGALGALDVNFLEPAYRRSCLLVGSEAVARWDWTDGSIVISREGYENRLVEVRGDVAETYRAELVDFLEAVENGGRPMTRADEGLAALQLAVAVKRSASEARTVSVD
jgi:predicted dehydrogenase